MCAAIHDNRPFAGKRTCWAQVTIAPLFLFTAWCTPSPIVSVYVPADAIGAKCHRRQAPRGYGLCLLNWTARQATTISHAL